MLNFKKNNKERDDERLRRSLRNMDRRDCMEQKLSVDRTFTQIRDERVSRKVDRINSKKKR